MGKLQLDIPDEVLIGLKQSPESLADELRTAAAVKLYELGKLSSGRAAQLAGVSRVAFLMLLGRYRVSAFPTDAQQLARDVAGTTPEGLRIVATGGAQRNPWE